MLLGNDTTASSAESIRSINQSISEPTVAPSGGTRGAQALWAPSSRPLASALPVLVGDHGRDNDAALDDLLVMRIDVEEREA